MVVFYFSHGVIDPQCIAGSCTIYHYVSHGSEMYWLASMFVQVFESISSIGMPASWI
jgi:hypothetical protein